MANPPKLEQAPAKPGRIGSGLPIQSSESAAAGPEPAPTAPASAPEPEPEPVQAVTSPPKLEQAPTKQEEAPAEPEGEIGSALHLEQQASQLPSQSDGLDGILDDILEQDAAPAPATGTRTSAGERPVGDAQATPPPLPVAVNAVPPSAVATRQRSTPKPGVDGVIDSVLGRNAPPPPPMPADRSPADAEGRRLESGDPAVWRTLPPDVRAYLGRGPNHRPQPLGPAQWSWALNQRDHPEVSAIPPPRPENGPSSTRTVAAPTATDIDKANIFRRVLDGDPTVARTDAQVARNWITAELASGNPAVVGLFSEQELADAGYGHSMLNDVTGNLLSPPARSRAPVAMLPVPGTRVVQPPPAKPKASAPRKTGWVDTFLSQASPVPDAARDPARLPVPITGRPIVGPAKPRKPVTHEQVSRLLYPPELVDAQKNGGDIESGLDPLSEEMARTSDGRPVSKSADNPFESWAFDLALQQRRLVDPANQPCQPGGPCYRGAEPPELLLGEFRELCTGDPSKAVTADTSRSCLQRAIYGDPDDSGLAPEKRYFGLAVDQIEPEDRPEPVKAGETLKSKARDAARRWYGVEQPTQQQIMRAAQEIVGANPKRFPGAGGIDINQGLASGRPLVIPASPAEVRSYRQAVLDGEAIDNVHVLRQRDAFINEPMPAAPANGDEPDYYRRGPGGVGYIRATEDEYREAVAEMGKEAADALFMPARQVERRIPLTELDAGTRADVEQHYEELRTSEASNKDYVPSEGLAAPQLSGDTRIYVPGTAAQLDWYVRHRGLPAARDAFAADGWIPHDIEASPTERTLYDSRNFQKDFEENVVPMAWEIPKGIGVELWNRTVADPVERVRRIESGAGDATDVVGALPLVGGAFFGPPTEPRDGQPWLEHYAERYPATGGTMQLGVDVFERYGQPAWGGLVEGVGQLTGLRAWEDYGAKVLRDNRTFVDPLTGETKVGDLKLVRDYRERPASTFVADGSIALMATGVRLVPLRELVGKGTAGLATSGRLGAATVRAGRSVVGSKPFRRLAWGVTTLANVTDPVILTGNALLGAKHLGTRARAKQQRRIAATRPHGPTTMRGPLPGAHGRLGLRRPTRTIDVNPVRAQRPLRVPGRVRRPAQAHPRSIAPRSAAPRVMRTSRRAAVRRPAPRGTKRPAARAHGTTPRPGHKLGTSRPRLGATGRVPRGGPRAGHRPQARSGVRRTSSKRTVTRSSGARPRDTRPRGTQPPSTRPPLTRRPAAHPPAEPVRGREVAQGKPAARGSAASPPRGLRPPLAGSANERFGLRRADDHANEQHTAGDKTEPRRHVLERLLALLGVGFLLHEGTTALLAGAGGRRVRVERADSPRAAPVVDIHSRTPGVHAKNPNDNGRPPPPPEIHESTRFETPGVPRDMHDEGTPTRGPPPPDADSRSTIRVAAVAALRLASRVAAVAVAAVAVTLLAQTIHWHAGAELMQALLPVVALPSLKTGLTRPGRGGRGGQGMRPGYMYRARARINGLAAVLSDWDPVILAARQRELRLLNQWQLSVRGQMLREQLELHGDLAHIRHELLALAGEVHRQERGRLPSVDHLRLALNWYRRGIDAGALTAIIDRVLGGGLVLPSRAVRARARVVNRRLRALETLRLSPWRSELARIFAEEQLLRTVKDPGLYDRYKELQLEVRRGERLSDQLPAVYGLVAEHIFRVGKLAGEPIVLRVNQLVGAIEAFYGGRIIEMATGQGKTLVPLPVIALDALTGNGGLHVWTSDTAAARNGFAEAREYLEPLGITLGLITRDGATASTVGGGQRSRKTGARSSRPQARRPVTRTRPGRRESAPVPRSTDHRANRRAAYSADVTYGVWDAVGFDSMMLGDRDLGIRFRRVILDEADRILIDNADTPLILSGQAERGRVVVSPLAYHFFASLVEYLEGPVGATERAPHYVQRNGAPMLTAEGWAEVRSKIRNRWELLGDDWHLLGPDELPMGVSERTRLVVETLRHLVQKALEAKHLNAGYHVADGDIKLHDSEHRTADGRRFRDGLDNALRAKHGLEIKQPSQMVDRMTVEALVKRFEVVSGMTGTARPAAREFRRVYGLRVVTVPRHGANNRIDHPDRIFATAREKIDAAVADIVERHRQGQPVLVGMTSTNRARLLQRRLRDEGIRARLLTAKNEKHESYVIAQAGRRGAVTISTITYRAQHIRLGGDAMVLAGRLERRLARADESHTADRVFGLLARLSEERRQVMEVGLYVLGLERDEVRRNDDQLRGRAGRGEEPGESRFYVSHEDPLVVQNTSPRSLRRGGARVVRRAIARAGRRPERARARTRRYERPLTRQRQQVLEMIEDGNRVAIVPRWSAHLETAERLRQDGVRGFAYRRALRRSFAAEMTRPASRRERPLAYVDVIGDGSIPSRRPRNPLGVDLVALNEIRSGRARYDHFTAPGINLLEHAAQRWIERPGTELEYRLADEFAELLPQRALDDWELWEADRLRMRSAHGVRSTAVPVAPVVFESSAPDYELAPAGWLERLDRRARTSRPAGVTESAWYSATVVERAASLTEREIAEARVAVFEAEGLRSFAAAGLAGWAQRGAEEAERREQEYLAMVQRASGAREDAEEESRVERSLDVAFERMARKRVLAWRQSEPQVERDVAATRARLADLVWRQAALRYPEGGDGPYDAAVEESGRAHRQFAWVRAQQRLEANGGQADHINIAVEGLPLGGQIDPARVPFAQARLALGAARAKRRELALVTAGSLASANEAVRIARAAAIQRSRKLKEHKEQAERGETKSTSVALGLLSAALMGQLPDPVVSIAQVSAATGGVVAVGWLMYKAARWLIAKAARAGPARRAAVATIAAGVFAASSVTASTDVQADSSAVPAVVVADVAPRRQRRGPGVGAMVGRLSLAETERLTHTIETALSAIENGEDVPEFGADLPTGILEHRWTQLRGLYAVVVERKTLAVAARELHLVSESLRLWVSAFMAKGRLSDLPLPRGDTWRLFILDDLRHIEEEDQLFLLADGRLTDAEVGRQLGVSVVSISRAARRYLTARGRAPRAAPERSKSPRLMPHHQGQLEAALADVLAGREVEGFGPLRTDEERDFRVRQLRGLLARAGGLSAREAGEIAGVTGMTITNWATRFIEGGFAALPALKTRTDTTRKRASLGSGKRARSRSTAESRAVDQKQANAASAKADGPDAARTVIELFAEHRFVPVEDVHRSLRRLGLSRRAAEEVVDALLRRKLLERVTLARKAFYVRLAVALVAAASFALELAVAADPQGTSHAASGSAAIGFLWLWWQMRRGLPMPSPSVRSDAARRRRAPPLTAEHERQLAAGLADVLSGREVDGFGPITTGKAWSWRIRQLLALLAIARNEPRAEAADFAGVTRKTTFGWQRRFVEGGFAALPSSPRPVRRRRGADVAATLTHDAERIVSAHVDRLMARADELRDELLVGARVGAELLRIELLLALDREGTRAIIERGVSAATIRQALQRLLHLPEGDARERYLTSLPAEQIADAGSAPSSPPEAYFKTTSRPEVDHEFWGHEPEQGLRNEVAAWRLAAALGPELARLVATVVWRELEGREGILSRRLPGEVGAWQEATGEEKRWAAFFDALIGNQDRQGHNAVTTPLGLFDHELAFPGSGDYPITETVFVRWRWWAAREELMDREREMLRQLLDSPDLLGIEQLLPSFKAEALRERARWMLEHGTILPPQGVNREDLNDRAATFDSLKASYNRYPATRPTDWDFGHWHEVQEAFLVSWVPRTREVVAVRTSEPSSEPRVLGKVAEPETLGTLLSRPDSPSTLAWVKEQVETVAVPTGRVVIDFTNKSATVIPDDGGSYYTYGPGVTRRNVAEAIGVDGWRFAEASEWALTSPPEGFWRSVEQDTSESHPRRGSVLAALLLVALSFAIDLWLAARSAGLGQDGHGVAAMTGLSGLYLWLSATNRARAPPPDAGSMSVGRVTVAVTAALAFMRAALHVDGPMQDVVLDRRPAVTRQARHHVPRDDREQALDDLSRVALLPLPEPARVALRTVPTEDLLQFTGDWKHLVHLDATGREAPRAPRVRHLLLEAADATDRVGRLRELLAGEFLRASPELARALAAILPELRAAASLPPVIVVNERVVQDTFGHPSIVFGSAPGPHGLTLADPAAAPQHGQLQRDEHTGRWWVHVFGQASQVFVSGVPVRSEALELGDRVAVGNTTFFIHPRNVALPGPRSDLLKGATPQFVRGRVVVVVDGYGRRLVIERGTPDELALALALNVLGRAAGLRRPLARVLRVRDGAPTLGHDELVLASDPVEADGELSRSQRRNPVFPLRDLVVTALLGDPYALNPAALRLIHDRLGAGWLLGNLGARVERPFDEDLATALALLPLEPRPTDDQVLAQLEAAVAEIEYALNRVVLAPRQRDAILARLARAQRIVLDRELPEPVREILDAESEAERRRVESIERVLKESVPLGGRFPLKAFVTRLRTAGLITDTEAAQRQVIDIINAQPGFKVFESQGVVAHGARGDAPGAQETSFDPSSWKQAPPPASGRPRRNRRAERQRLPDSGEYVDWLNFADGWMIGGGRISRRPLTAKEKARERAARRAAVVVRRITGDGLARVMGLPREEIGDAELVVHRGLHGERLARNLFDLVSSVDGNQIHIDEEVLATLPEHLSPQQTTWYWRHELHHVREPHLSEEAVVQAAPFDLGPLLSSNLFSVVAPTRRRAARAIVSQVAAVAPARRPGRDRRVIRAVKAVLVAVVGAAAIFAAPLAVWLGTAPTAVAEPQRPTVPVERETAAAPRPEATGHRPIRGPLAELDAPIGSRTQRVKPGDATWQMEEDRLQLEEDRTAALGHRKPRVVNDNPRFQGEVARRVGLFPANNRGRDPALIYPRQWVTLATPRVEVAPPPPAIEQPTPGPAPAPKPEPNVRQTDQGGANNWLPVAVGGGLGVGLAIWALRHRKARPRRARRPRTAADIQRGQFLPRGGRGLRVPAATAAARRLTRVVHRSARVRRGGARVSNATVLKARGAVVAVGAAVLRVRPTPAADIQGGRFLPRGDRGPKAPRAAKRPDVRRVARAARQWLGRLSAQMRGWTFRAPRSKAQRSLVAVELETGGVHRWLPAVGFTLGGYAGGTFAAALGVGPGVAPLVAMTALFAATGGLLVGVPFGDRWGPARVLSGGALAGGAALLALVAPSWGWVVPVAAAIAVLRRMGARIPLSRFSFKARLAVGGVAFGAVAMGLGVLSSGTGQFAVVVAAAWVAIRIAKGAVRKSLRGLRAVRRQSQRSSTASEANDLSASSSVSTVTGLGFSSDARDLLVSAVPLVAGVAAAATVGWLTWLGLRRRRGRLGIDATEAERLERSLLELPTRAIAYARPAFAPVGEGSLKVPTRRVGAYFKPAKDPDSQAVYGFGPGQTARNERAAWRLAVGLHPLLARMVAPVVLFELDGREGHLSYRLRGRVGGWWGLHRPDKLSAAFFDSLIRQWDRNRGNWVTKLGRVGLFDHEIGFQEGDLDNFSLTPFVEWRYGAGRSALTEIERDMLRRLLGSQDLFQVEELLTPANAEALRARARRMLELGVILVPEWLIREEADRPRPWRRMSPKGRGVAGLWRRMSRTGRGLAGLRLAAALEAHGHKAAAHSEFESAMDRLARVPRRRRWQEIALKAAGEGLRRTARAVALLAGVGTLVGALAFGAPPPGSSTAQTGAISPAPRWVPAYAPPAGLVEPPVTFVRPLPRGPVSIRGPPRAKEEQQ